MQKVNQEPIARAELKVNGKEIKLNNFVESFISQTVIGMVKSLRGVGDIETVDLRISKKSEWIPPVEDGTGWTTLENLWA